LSIGLSVLLFMASDESFLFCPLWERGHHRP
jgi:hypothetical protein